MLPLIASTCWSFCFETFVSLEHKGYRMISLIVHILNTCIRATEVTLFSKLGFVYAKRPCLLFVYCIDINVICKHKPSRHFSLISPAFCYATSCSSNKTHYLRPIITHRDMPRINILETNDLTNNVFVQFKNKPMEGDTSSYIGWIGSYHTCYKTQANQRIVQLYSDII